jgi:hypothetical protein
MVGLADHMWQTLQVFVCLALFAFLTRLNSARFRIWLWRAAALKLAIPFYLLYAIGAWLGFPVAHSAHPPPRALVQLLDQLASWVAPAAHLNSAALWLFLVGLALAVAAAAWRTRRALQVDGALVAEELNRLARDPDDRPRGVGFINSALITAWALLVLTGPLLSGALDDRLARQALLQRNEAGLRDAAVVVKPAAPGMGSRYRVVADEDGITIRNATLQEIGGLAYGVSVYLVRGQHFMKEGERDWLTGFRHDVRVTGRVIQPEDFDTYALRSPLTKALATQFGLEIYQNGKCQPPCGRWGSVVLPPEVANAAPADLD